MPCRVLSVPFGLGGGPGGPHGRQKCRQKPVLVSVSFSVGPGGSLGALVGPLGRLWGLPLGAPGASMGGPWGCLTESPRPGSPGGSVGASLGHLWGFLWGPPGCPWAAPGVPKVGLFLGFFDKRGCPPAFIEKFEK